MAELNRMIGGLTCADVLSLLSAYVDGDLERAERDAVEAHARACDNCGRFGGRFAEVIAALRQSAPPMVADPIRSRKLSERLARELYP